MEESIDFRILVRVTKVKKTWWYGVEIWRERQLSLYYGIYQYVEYEYQMFAQVKPRCRELTSNIRKIKNSFRNIFPANSSIFQHLVTLTRYYVV